MSSPSELQAYVVKVESYLTAYDTAQIGIALFLSNVAAQLALPGTAATVPVDSALYLESPGRTLSLVPRDFSITKLYLTVGGSPSLMSYGFSSSTTLASYQQVTLPSSGAEGG